MQDSDSRSIHAQTMIAHMHTILSICARKLECSGTGEPLLETLRPNARHICCFQVAAPNMMTKVQSLHAPVAS